jgi:BNR repeat-like domain
MVSRFAPPRRIEDAEHSIVYRNDAEFCGWPFICGFWTPANGDLLAAFKKKPANYQSPEDVNHDEVAKVGPTIVTIRSTDRGQSWDAGSMQALFKQALTNEQVFGDGPPDYSSEGPVDFTDSNVLVASGATPDYFRPYSEAWMRVSTDGGMTWRRPIRAPKVGLPSLSGNASPLVRRDGVSLIFMTSVSADGWKRRPVVYASVNDGAYWTFLSFITPLNDDGSCEPDRTMPLRFGAHRYFYPRPLLLPDGRILCSVRCQRDPTSLLWTEMFVSEDDGHTWRFLSRVNDWGAPGDLALMADGRVACVYGYRLPPYGIRARISEDAGRTWGPELILRDDGGSWDLGYPRVVEVEPGRLLAVYYMNRKDDPIQMNGGVRHIAQTIFTPH